ncbi:invasin domain 3-containing protein [Lelliottia nimipressuralis]|uniref:invasin domain 3-containing protein n=1 Tax=Lelliottia nimipressuralis TaxID=69220 RepID=UPI00355745F8
MRNIPPCHIRVCAWINICLQLLAPSAVTFMPAHAAAKAPSHDAGALVTQQTQPYTLDAGETTDSVARKFGITLVELRKLNQFRTFAHKFEQLRPGDELDVPRLSVTPGSQPENRQSPGDGQAAQVAGIASQAGAFLSNDPGADAAAAMARGMATGAATSEVQKWMAQFGTARVQLDTDRDFSLKNSQFDLLMPLYEQQTLLAFTQGSFHRTDERTQSNLGFGVRWFSDDWMLGGNTFVDYDLSRDHARAGVGMEYWRDYLKLGANSYLRLTNWKNSPDLDGYEERPADGWDLRTQAWLPALPQLGGKLMYEQYYGNDVALFGKDNRQRDPHAFTFGLDYTPVPLVTLTTEQRQGKAGENDTRFGLELRYQPGTPWGQQVDPDAVAVMRSLAGSRHDFVERNNNIILEYRRKDDIRLRTASLVTGYAGEKKSLGVSVTSHNGLERIDWSAPALLAAGGKITQDDPQNYSVILPVYQSVQGVNNYILTGVAVDRKGRRSNTSETQISVHAPVVSQTSSTFMPPNSTLTADGRSNQLLTLTLRDSQGETVDAPVTAINIRPDRLKSATLTEVSKKEPGVYEVTVTAGMDEETILLTPEVFGMTLSPARIAISRTGLSDTRSVITTDTDTISANDISTLKLSFTAKDVNDSPVTDQASQVTFRVLDSNSQPVTGPAVTVGATSEGEPGVYTATLHGTKAGHYTVTPLYKGQPVGSLSTGVELTAGEVDDKTSLFGMPDGRTVAADGTSTLTLSFTAQDMYGNPVTGQAQNVTFSVQDSSGPNAGLRMAADSGVTVGATTEKGNGVYTATLSGTKAGTWTVTPEYDGQALSSLSENVTLSAGTVDETQSEFVLPGESTVAADGTSPVALQFRAKDANGNPVAGVAQKVTFRVLDSNNQPVIGTGVTVDTTTEATPGVYTATLVGTKAGSYTVRPMYDSEPLESFRTDFMLTAGGIDGAHSAFVATGTSTVPADDQSEVTLQFTAKDANGNPVTGVASQVSFSVQDGVGAVTSPAVTVGTVNDNGNGVYTAQLHGTQAGTYTVKPLYNGSPMAVNGVQVSLTAGQVDSGISHFELSGDNIVGQGDSSRVKLTFTAKDMYGNPVTGQEQKVTFRVQDSTHIDAGNAVTIDTTTEAEPGVYTSMLYGTKAGTYTVTPEYEGQAQESLSKEVTLSAGAVDEAHSELTLPGESTVVADGTSPVALQFTAKDMYDNPVTGQVAKVTFRVQDSSLADASEVTIQAITEESAGVYTATLVGTRAGTYFVIPKYDGQPLNSLSNTVTLTAGDMDGVRSAIATTGTSTVPADGQSEVRLQFTAKDAHDNLVSGQVSRVTFRVLDSNNQTVTGTGVTVDATTEASPGIYTAQLHGTQAGTYTVKPKYDGTEVGTLSQQVTLTAGEVSGATSTFDLPGDTSVVADGTTSLPLRFAANDVSGNPVTGVANKVTFSVWDGSQEVTSGVTVDATTESGTPGIYTARLHGTQAGTYTVKPKYDGTEVGTLSQQVTLTAGEVSGATSTFDLPGDTSVVADGTTSLPLRFAANDVSGNPVTEVANKVTFSVWDGSQEVTSGVTVDATTEASPGIYTAQLHGTQAGTYTVKPKYDGTEVGTLSQQVTLTAGEISGATSTFDLPGDTSVVADDTTSLPLRFAANDVSGNPVTGVANKVTFSVWDGSQEVTSGVTVDATTESGTPGIYTARLHGTQAGTYTVKPKYDGTEVGALSRQVTLTAGDADGAHSGFDLPEGNMTIADGASMLKLSFTAKDMYGNPVTGQKSKVSFGVPDGSEVTVAATEDEGEGVYTTTLVGTKAGTWTVTPEFDGQALESLGKEVILKGAIKDIQVNGYSWSATSGFPKTGFVGAQFKMELKGENVTDYDWHSSAPWVSVEDGVVTFTSEGDKEPVIITATPKAGGTEIIYRFAVNNWFTVQNQAKNWNDAAAYCTDNGQQLPDALQLGGSQTKQYSKNMRGETGSLWSEWGDMTVYGFAMAVTYWTGTYQSSGYLGINLRDGQVNWGPVSNNVYVACVK